MIPHSPRKGLWVFFKYVNYKYFISRDGFCIFSLDYVYTSSFPLLA